MELTLSADQRALLDSLEPLLAHHKDIPQSDRRNRWYYARTLDRDLANSGYFDILRTAGNTPLEGALVVDASGSSSGSLSKQLEGAVAWSGRGLCGIAAGSGEHDFNAETLLLAVFCPPLRPHATFTQF